MSVVTACLACGVTASLAFLCEFLFGPRGAAVAGFGSGSLCLARWYVLPLARRSRLYPIEREG